MPPDDHERPVEYVVAEYEAATAAYLQYDGFRWQAGSLLIAGAFVFLGLLAGDNGDEATYAVGSLFVSLVMSIWILFAHHYRQLYLFKIDRLVELEFVMKAEQNRRFHDGLADTWYRPTRPAGHDLDLGIDLITCLGAPGLALAQGAASWWLAGPLTLALAITALVRRNERAVKPQRGRNLDRS